MIRLREDAFTLGLSLVVALLLLRMIVGYEAQPPAARDAADIDAAVSDDMRAVPDQESATGSSAAIDQRKMFAPPQREVPPQASKEVKPPPPVAPTRPEGRLVGTLISGEQRVAFVLITGAAEPKPLILEDEWAGWTVTNIGSDHVTLEQGGETQELGLYGAPPIGGVTLLTSTTRKTPIK